MRYTVAGFLLGIAFFATTPTVFAAACPEGYRLATAGDAVVHDPTSKIAMGTCYKPNEVGIGENAEVAREYLKSLDAGMSGQCTPLFEQYGRVNGSFAICAAQFLKAYQQEYGRVYVNRAFNNVACETDMCKRGPPGVGNVGCGGFARIAVSGGLVYSSHTTGLAMDVAVAEGVGSAQQLKLIEFANKNPRFGLCFPITSWDRVHLVAAGFRENGESNMCANIGVKDRCDAGNFDAIAFRADTATRLAASHPPSIKQPPQIVAQRQPLTPQQFRQSLIDLGFTTDDAENVVRNNRSNAEKIVKCAASLSVDPTCDPSKLAVAANTIGVTTDESNKAFFERMANQLDAKKLELQQTGQCDAPGGGGKTACQVLDDKIEGYRRTAQVFGFVGPAQEDAKIKTTWDKVYGLAKDFGSYVLRNTIRPAH